MQFVDVGRQCTESVGVNFTYYSKIHVICQPLSILGVAVC